MSVAQPLLATIEADEPSVENTNSAPRSLTARPPVASQTARSPRQMATTESDAESGPRWLQFANRLYYSTIFFVQEYQAFFVKYAGVLSKCNEKHLINILFDAVGTSPRSLLPVLLPHSGHLRLYPMRMVHE